MECIWVRRDEIRGQLVRDASSLSHCNLVDYDWKTKVSIISQPKVGTKSWNHTKDVLIILSNNYCWAIS